MVEPITLSLLLLGTTVWTIWALGTCYPVYPTRYVVVTNPVQTVPVEHCQNCQKADQKADTESKSKSV